MNPRDPRSPQTSRSGPPAAEERTLMLMMAALDGELAAGEDDELRTLLAADPALAAEWRRMEKVHEVTRMTRVETPSDELWTGYWQNVYHRLERGVGWVLLSLGAVVLIGWGLWQALIELLADTTMPLFAKLALFAVGLGTAILCLSTAREKFFTWKHDPYKEIER